jgi:esterase/lipase superfamily enzyme
MSDVTERWYSGRLGHDITVMRWGAVGTPVLVFPSAGGDAGEIERHGLVDACGPLMAEGRVKLYSVDSVAGQAMVTKAGSAEHRMWLLNQFHECVRREVVPAIHADLGGQAIDVITAGASIGAFNAVAVLCRYPDVFGAAIGMSGSYRIERFYDEAWSQDLYYSAPLQFVPGLEGPQLDRLRQRWRRSWGPRAFPTGWTTGARTGTTSGPPGVRCCRSTCASSPAESGRRGWRGRRRG